MMSTHQNHKEEVYSEVHEVMAGDKLTDTSERHCIQSDIQVSPL